MKRICPICDLEYKVSENSVYCSRCGAVLPEIEEERHAPRRNESSKLYQTLVAMKSLGGFACQLIVAAIALNFVAVVATGSYFFRIHLNMAVFLFLTGLFVGSIGYFGVEEMEDHEFDTFRGWLDTHWSGVSAGVFMTLLYAVAVVKLW
jgi:hypothetical protein